MKRAYINGILLDGTQHMEPQAHKVLLCEDGSHRLIRRAVKPEHFEEYGRQNGLFFLKAGCVMAVIGALDALVTLDALLYLLLYVFGFAFAFYPLTRWCKENEGFSWPWPRVESEKKRIKKLRQQQEAEKAEREEK